MQICNLCLANQIIRRINILRFFVCFCAPFSAPALFPPSACSLIARSHSSPPSACVVKPSPPALPPPPAPPSSAEVVRRQFPPKSRRSPPPPTARLPELSPCLLCKIAFSLQTPHPHSHLPPLPPPPKQQYAPAKRTLAARRLFAAFFCRLRRLYFKNR